MTPAVMLNMIPNIKYTFAQFLTFFGPIDGLVTIGLRNQIAQVKLMGHLGLLEVKLVPFLINTRLTSLDSKPLDDIPVSVPGSGSG